MRDRFVSVVSELLEDDPRLAVVMADITVDRFKASGAYQRHPLRVVNVGIREQLMVNVAAGMALEGMRPIAHSFAPFLIERSFEQVKLAFAHQGVGGILVSCGASYDTAAYGRTHQSPGDVALMATLPGWRIHVPGHPDEVETFLRDAAQTDDAVYIRLSERKNAAPAAGADGKLVVQRRGARGAPTVIAVGPMLDPVTEALAAARCNGVVRRHGAAVRPRWAPGGGEWNGRGPGGAVPRGDVRGGSVRRAFRPSTPVALHRRSAAEHRKYGSAERHDVAHGLDATGLRSRIGDWLGRGAGRELVAS